MLSAQRSQAEEGEPSSKSLESRASIKDSPTSACIAACACEERGGRPLLDLGLPIRGAFDEGRSSLSVWNADVGDGEPAAFSTSSGSSMGSCGRCGWSGRWRSASFQLPAGFEALAPIRFSWPERATSCAQSAKTFFAEMGTRSRPQIACRCRGTLGR